MFVAAQGDFKEHAGPLISTSALGRLSVSGRSRVRGRRRGSWLSWAYVRRQSINRREISLSTNRPIHRNESEEQKRRFVPFEMTGILLRRRLVLFEITRAWMIHRVICPSFRVRGVISTLKPRVCVTFFPSWFREKKTSDAGAVQPKRPSGF